MEKPAAIQKVKLLFRLAASAPEHESATATAMAQQIIAKFGLVPEEYEVKEVKPLYGDSDDDLLFSTPTEIEWKSILALVVGTKYDCFIIKEENIASTGDRVLKYFVYGDESDVLMTKGLFKFVDAKIDQLISQHCRSMSELYISSFGEGAVNGVRVNIEYETFNMPGLVKTTPKVETEVGSVAIAKIELEKKEAPLKDKTQVGNKEKPIDIIAYFTGESYGRDIHIGALFGDRELPDRLPYILNCADLSKIFDEED